MNWDWLAGYLDGRGCFSIHTTRRGSKTYQQFIIKVSDSNPNTLAKLKEMFGGSVTGIAFIITKKETVKIIINNIIDKMIFRKEFVTGFKKKMEDYDIHGHNINGTAERGAVKTE